MMLIIQYAMHRKARKGHGRRAGRTTLAACQTKTVGFVALIDDLVLATGRYGWRQVEYATGCVYDDGSWGGGREPCDGYKQPDCDVETGVDIVAIGSSSGLLLPFRCERYEPAVTHARRDVIWSSNFA
jgi:hypothetical protein